MLGILREELVHKENERKALQSPASETNLSSLYPHQPTHRYSSNSFNTKCTVHDVLPQLISWGKKDREKCTCGDGTNLIHLQVKPKSHCIQGPILYHIQLQDVVSPVG